MEGEQADSADKDPGRLEPDPVPEAIICPRHVNKLMILGADKLVKIFMNSAQRILILYRVVFSLQLSQESQADRQAFKQTTTHCTQVRKKIKQTKRHADNQMTFSLITELRFSWLRRQQAIGSQPAHPPEI